MYTLNLIIIIGGVVKHISSYLDRDDLPLDDTVASRLAP